jgi:aflatoxin B1 aldehyde reductase
VDTYYLHSPDPATPLPETLEAIQKLYVSGAFKNFGISNFLPAEVQAVHDYMSAHHYILPTVYEGNYNPIGRHAETALFPLLRDLGMTFNAYAALAGGFLMKSQDEIMNGGGRWDLSTPVGQMHHRWYNKPKLLESLTIWDTISKDSGISKADLSYRWVAYHSQLGKGMGQDGIVLGASSSQQLKKTLEGLRAGPLPETVVERIDDVWDTVKEDAILDNYNIRNF